MYPQIEYYSKGIVWTTGGECKTWCSACAVEVFWLGFMVGSDFFLLRLRPKAQFLTLHFLQGIFQVAASAKMPDRTGLRVLSGSRVIFVVCTFY